MGALILLLLVTTRRIRQEQARYTAAVDVLDDLTSGELADAEDVNKDDFVVATAALKSASIAMPSEDSEAVADDDSSAVVAQFQADWLPEVDDSEDQFADLKRQLELAKRRRDDLVTEKVDLEKVLLAQQDEFLAVSDQIQELEDELLTTGREVRQLKDAETELNALRSEKDDLELQIVQQKKMLAGVQAELEEKSVFTDDAESVLTKRESALISLRRMVAKSSENLAQESTATQLEFTGTAGTAKVPIVINVDEKGFTFEPTGIVITKKDLIGFPANDNPLISGIQAVAASRSEGLLADKAYVLLLVRPSGSLGFYQAQQLLTNANIHFGYELLEADQTIAVGTENQEEVKVVREAILEALNRRSTLYGALLAAQQEAAYRRENDWGQSRSTGGAGGQVVARPNSNDRRGADGRTLEEIMRLGRVYAAGEPKPAPKVPTYRKPRLGQEAWSESGNQVATNFPEPKGFAEHSQAAVDAADVSGQPFRSQVNQLPQSEVASSHFDAQEDGRGDGSQLVDLRAEIRSDRSSELSGNMGLNGQLSQRQMPNEAVAEPPFGGEIVTADSARHRISPDVDWPFVEVAPQPKGSRPVDPELLSNSVTGEATDPLLGNPLPASSPFDSEQFADAAQQPALDFDSSSTAFEDFVARQQLNNSAFGQPQGAGPPPATRQQQAFAQAAQDVQSSNAEAVPVVNSTSPLSAFAGQGEGQGPGDGGRPIDPKQSYLQQFLDEVEKQRSQNKPNAELLRLLHQAKANKRDILSGNLASPTLDQDKLPEPTVEGRKSVLQATQLPSFTSPQPPNTSPDDAQRERPPVYYVIRIYISDKQLVVGSFEPIDVSGWSNEQVAEAAFQGVSETMNGVWVNQRKDALPAVRFLVGDGSQQRSVYTSQQL